PVDWSGRLEDSCGSTVQGRPRRRKRRGGSPKRPRKAKSLERRSTDNFNKAYGKKHIVKDKFISIYGEMEG
ncbi:hypothetical protein ABES03_13665, partial [Neobacillus rhizosphaerae]|uniref:hypothetical protein n=1 Tax=Neobacillus rhizosphaerae TaxID=2880965 RepID=UPI003D2D4AA5